MMENESGFTDVTFAMDLSLSSPGFAVLAVFEGGPILLETSHTKTNASRNHGYRLDQIACEMERYYMAYKPKHVVREKGFSRFAASTQAIFKVVGTSDLVAHWHRVNEITEIPPITVKKVVTGVGKASKEEVADAVFRIMKIENKDEYYTKHGNLIDDKTDAIAVGLCYLAQKELITI